MIKTFKYRLKSKNIKALPKMASAVNFVWNYCNQTSIEYLEKKNKWVSKFDLGKLTSGCSKFLGIHSSSIQLVGDQYFNKRNQFKKRKLAWRSSKRSLGWIPFRSYCVKIEDDEVTYNKVKFRFWLSRPIEGKIKSGQFSCDTKGNWFITFSCEVPSVARVIDKRSVGIDLGLKTIATLSNGMSLNRENLTKTYADKLAIAQRARKKKQITDIHLKIKNKRKDWNHKQTTFLVNSFGHIGIGNVSSSKLMKTKMSKSVSDASWHDFKSMLSYKAIALGVEYKEINEMFSTVTCSSCLERTGPSGLSALGVREWTCKCGASHSRDVNAAKNILRISHDTPIKGVPLKKGKVPTLMDKTFF